MKQYFILLVFFKLSLLQSFAQVETRYYQTDVVEIKLGGDDLIEEGASSLITLRNKIVEKSDEKAPSFLLVLTAVGGAYKREDGVFVAPINLLKP